jgi:hypothetical protein
MPLQPCHAFRRFHIPKRPPHRILATNLAHRQQLRIHSVEAERGDVCVPPMTRQNRQKDRAQNFRLRRRVGTRVDHRATFHPLVPQACCLQKLDEKCQLTERRHRRCLIPFHVNHSAVGIHRAALIRSAAHHQFALTLWVNDGNFLFYGHRSQYQLLADAPYCRTAVSRIMRTR